MLLRPGPGTGASLLYKQDISRHPSGLVPYSSVLDFCSGGRVNRFDSRPGCPLVLMTGFRDCPKPLQDMLEQYFKIGHDRSVPHSSQFIINDEHPIPRYIQCW